MIDVNLHLSRWPCRRLPDDDTPALVARLRAAGVTQGWAGSFDALLHHDLTAVNRRVAEDCAQHGAGLLLPVGSLNSALPGWQEDLRRCIADHGMRVIRLYPSYHGYALDDPRCAALLDAAAEQRLVVQVVFKMEDERTHHPLLKVPTVDPQPLAALIAARPALRMVLLNSHQAVRGDALGSPMQSGQVWCDIATLEGIRGIERLLKVVPFERILFGSHAPFFNHRAAVLKLQESELAEPVRQAIAVENARRLLNAAAQ
jgi:predicted TIM-barrel fold metal-dependent hydrolase